MIFEINVIKFHKFNNRFTLGFCIGLKILHLQYKLDFEMEVLIKYHYLNSIFLMDLPSMCGLIDSP